MARIEDLLHRRNDLSTFLVHLTRTSDDANGRQHLLSIVEESTIRARSPFGPAAHLEEHLAGSSSTQKVVCFTETPLEHAWMMLQDIEGRQVHFEPYGLAITKTTARKAHFNPVWYSDISTRGGRDWPMAAVNQMIADATARATDAGGDMAVEVLRTEPIFRLTPFYEQMGPMRNGWHKEFWWEREWRHVDDYVISFPSRIVTILAPEGDHEALRAELEELSPPWAKRPVLDPRWGLERMIAELAGIAEEHVGPFPDAF